MLCFVFTLSLASSTFHFGLFASQACCNVHFFFCIIGRQPRTRCVLQGASHRTRKRPPINNNEFNDLRLSLFSLACFLFQFLRVCAFVTVYFLLRDLHTNLQRSPLHSAACSQHSIWTLSSVRCHTFLAVLFRLFSFQHSCSMDIHWSRRASLFLAVLRDQT